MSGTATVAANATDASGVSLVEFWIDGVNTITDSTSPYTYSWDTTSATNGSHSLVVKAYDTWSNMGTSDPVSMTVNNVLAPPALVANGGFEVTSSPWAFPGHASWASGTAHTGSRYALFGDRNRAKGSVSQSVTIPAGTTADLTFWLSVTSNDTSATASDFVHVEVVDAGVASLLGTYSNLHKGAAGAYSQKGFSLAQWRGKTVTLRFRVTTNSKLPISFYVDDVSLQ